MKQLAYLVLIAMVLFSYSDSDARNTRLKVSIQEALELGEREGRLDNSIRLYFGSQSHPAIQRRLGTYTSVKKTSGVGKSDQRACKWAFLSAVITLQGRAVREGGNAVVNIRSKYGRNELSSTTDFECGAGAVLVGVTLVGDVVKIAN